MNKVVRIFLKVLKYLLIVFVVACVFLSVWWVVSSSIREKGTYTALNTPWWEHEDISLYTLDPETRKVDYHRNSSEFFKTVEKRMQYKYHRYVEGRRSVRRIAHVDFIPALPDEQCDRIAITQFDRIQIHSYGKGAALRDGYASERSNGTCGYSIVEGFTHTEGYFEKILAEIVFPNPPYTRNDNFWLYQEKDKIRDDVRFRFIEVVDRIPHTDSINLKHLCGFYGGDFSPPDSYENFPRELYTEDGRNISVEELAEYTNGICILPPSGWGENMPATCLHKYGKPRKIAVSYSPPCPEGFRCDASNISRTTILCGL